MDIYYWFLSFVNFIFLAAFLQHEEAYAAHPETRFKAPGEVNKTEAKSMLRKKRFVFTTALLIKAAIAAGMAAAAAGTATGVALAVEEDSDESKRREARRENRLRRVCPTRCWSPWPSGWSACSQPCGGGGYRRQTRTEKSSYALGECSSWVSSNGCPGSRTRSEACNRFCRNNGTLHSQGCTCPAGFRGQCCDTRIICPAPGVPAHGTTFPNSNGLHYGTVVRFTCNTGYYRVGPESRECARTGTWTNRVPVCNIVSCGNPGGLANGNLTYTTGNPYVYGSTLTAACDYGYRLLGTTIRSCRFNGRWSGTASSCLLIVCPIQPAPANGAVSYPSGRNLNDRLVYTCDVGYVLQGAASRLCRSTSQWTSQSATCAPIFCNNIASPMNGKVTHGGTTGRKTPFGQNATFSCNQGYVLQGTAVLTCEGDSVVGQFNGQPPTCEPVDCGDPGNPTNGVRSGSEFTLGQTVAFSCNPGYYLEGELGINCVHTGQWSSVKPLCKACALNKYKPSTNNAKFCSVCPANSGTGNMTGASSKTQCLCVRGYKGSPGGPCSLIQCPALPVPANGHRVSCGNRLDEKCIFACDAGHVISRGNTERTCTELEKWSGSNIQCDACPRDTYRLSPSQCDKCPNNSRTAATGNEKVGCVCLRGYAGPNGGPCDDIDECSTSNGGCEQTCVNQPGDYTCECTNAGYVKDLDDFKKCVAKNHCPNMAKPANGGAVCYSQKKTNTERCYVNCNKGFEHLEKPNAYEECGPSTNWQWTYDIKQEPVPDCISAFFPGEEVELEVFYFKGDCLSLNNTQKKEIAKEFVEFLKGKRICTFSNQGTCSIDDVDVGCGVEEEFEDEGFPDFGFGGLRRKRDTRMGLVIKFKLKSKTKELPKDRECDAICREKVNNETKAQIAEEAKVVFELFTKTNEEESNVTLGGVELLQTRKIKVGDVTPSCEKGQQLKNGACVTVSCGLPKPPANGKIDVNGHLYNETTELSCSALYALKGDNSTTCQADGKWSTYDTTCIHFRDLKYDCVTKNPCNPRRLTDRQYFRHLEPNKFIHCTTRNQCLEKTCPRGLLLSNKHLVCVYKWHLSSY